MTKSDLPWKDPWRGDAPQQKPPWRRRLARLAAIGMVTSMVLGVVLCGFASSSGGRLLGTLTAVVAVVFWLSMLAGIVSIYINIAHVLFRQIQIRLYELMLIVMLLGNAIGWSCRAMSDRLRDDPGGFAFSAATFALIASLFILGGAAWGLKVATVLKRRGGWQRLWLMLVGVTAVPAFLGTIVAAIWTLVLLEEQRRGFAAIMGTAFAICLAISVYAIRLSRAIRRLGHADWVDALGNALEREASEEASGKAPAEDDGHAGEEPR